MATERSSDADEVIMPLGMVDASHPAFSLSGRVADSWALFEFHVDRTIWKLACASDGAGACITSQMVSVHSRLRALRTLVELAGGNADLLKEIDSLAGKSQETGEERNRMVHDPWMLNATKRTVGKMQITAKKRLQMAYVAVPLNTVESLLSKISSHTSRFLKLEERLWSELSASSNKSRSPAAEEPQQGSL